MDEHITLKANEVVALINILENLYLWSDCNECVNSMYDDMRVLRRLRDELKLFDEEDK